MPGVYDLVGILVDKRNPLHAQNELRKEKEVLCFESHTIKMIPVGCSRSHDLPDESRDQTQGGTRFDEPRPHSQPAATETQCWPIYQPSYNTQPRAI